MNTLKRIFGSFVDEQQKSNRSIQTVGKFYKVKKAGPNYDVTVDVTGDSPYSTCVISINAVTGGERKLPIAARYSWRRYWRGGQEQEIQTTSNTLHVSPLDSGCFIKVYITPMEEDTIYNEVSTVVFGPIVLDPLTKRTIQGIMRAGGFKFQVDRFMIAESEELGTDGMIILSQSCMHLVSRKNPKFPIKVILSQPIKISSQRNHLKTFTLEFSDEEVSRDICKLFGVPFSRSFKKVKFVMSSMNSKDLLLLAIHLFRSMQSIKDTELFQMVTEYIKDAPPTSMQNSSTEKEIDSDESAGEEVRLPDSPERPMCDAIDKLFLNNGMKEEIFKLYSTNQQLAVQRNELQMRVVNLESELTKSISRSSGVPDQDPMRSPEQDISNYIDVGKINLIKQRNTEISANIKTIENQSIVLKNEVERLTGVFKQMRYKELLDSKLNASARRAPEKDISGLERALEDYAQEYKKLVENLGGGKENADMMLPNSDERSLSLVDEMEDRALEILMKNERLKDDIQKHKNMINEMESKKEAKRVGASFIGNESFLKATPMRTENKVEYEVKIETLDNRIQRLTLENKDLNEQISSLKSKLAEQDENDQQARIYNKLKHQQNELKSILSDKRHKLAELHRTRITLSDKEMDMRASVLVNEDHSAKLAEMKAKKQQLEKTHKLMSNEIEDQKAVAAKLEKEHRQMVTEFSTMGSPLPRPSSSSLTIDRMKANIKDVEDKISRLQASTPATTSHPIPPTTTINDNDRQSTGDELSAAERQQFDTEKKMNERLMTEITRLNDVILKYNVDNTIL